MSTIVTTTFQLPQAVISNGAVTGNAWSNPNNLLLVDGQVAESDPAIGSASDVILGNYNTNIPSNATILGIQMNIFAYGGAQTSPQLTLTPTAVDNTSGTPVYYPYDVPITGLTGTLTEYSIGSPTYLFGTTWTVDMINNFKLQLNANGDMYVDSALVAVTYEIPSPSTPAIGTGGDPIQAQPFYLALDMAPGDRYAYLYSMNYVDNTPIKYADLGASGGVLNFTFDPGVPQAADGTGNFEENCATATWTTMENGYVQLDFGSTLSGRGLLYKYPYTSTPSLMSGHNQNAKVIISNNAPEMGQYLQTSGQGITYNGPVTVENQGTTLQTETASLNFAGAGVSTTVDGSGNATVTISGGSGGASTAAPLLVDYATAAILPNTPTYNNGTSGVGATLTASANAALVVDGATVAAGKLILVKNQGTPAQNGVYVVTTAGSGSVAWKLTRVSNYNTIAQINYSGPVAVLSGTANPLTGWALTTNTLTAIGTSAISYVEYITNATFATLTGVQTLSNKRITKRFVAISPTATPAINTDNTDIASITALGTNITSMTSGLTGTPNAGDYLMIQITDNGVARTITWGSSFISTTVSLPATTAPSTLLRVGFQWDTVSNAWNCIAVA